MMDQYQRFCRFRFMREILILGIFGYYKTERLSTVTPEGDANGAPHPDPSAYAAKFTGKHVHTVTGGIGHNLPQEAPKAFADAIIEAGAMAK